MIIHDPAKLKLGKKPARQDSRTLRLAKYLSSDLPQPPDSVDWSHGIERFGMMENNRLGDCTIAACAHAVQMWTANQGAERTLGDDVVVDYYSKWSGYIPGQPQTDRGAFEIDVLNRWRKEGFAGCILEAYADADLAAIEQVKQSIALFGGLYAGLALPISAQAQQIWDICNSTDGTPGSWGGHAVFVCAYDHSTLTCITWGARKKMTWAFWLNYADEAHVLFSPLWLDRDGDSPTSIDFRTLSNDLCAITR